MSLLWEGYQQRKISDARKTAENAQSTANKQAYNITDIHQKLERLALASQAMWELLRDHSDLNEQDIEAKILEIDGRDGQVDGKISAQTLDCPSCGRPTNSKRTNCVICGAEFPKAHKFEV